MRIKLLLVLAGMLPLFLVNAQNARSYDGRGNNLLNTDWGSTHIPMIAKTANGFADGIGEPGGMDRPSPRIISNELFRQDSLIPDVMHLSDFCWVFGQFIDHDITLTENNGAEPLMIPVPAGDPWFDPFNTGQMVIPTSRTHIMPGTGTDVDNPRSFPNVITSFLDASAVYGSDEARANWLRTHANGMMKTSAGNLLPYNTITGEYDSDIDPNAPHMADDVGFFPKLFVAGDVRANENPLLLAFHTLFVREHNRIAAELRLLHPNWRDEQLFQGARKRVSAIIQAIVYEEWLPTMGIQLPPYSGYNSGENPGIFNVFAAAAFRMGHTLLNGNLMRVDNNGETLAVGNLELKDAFFNPEAIHDAGGIEPYFKGMGIQVQQGFDAKVIDDVRNFLFGPPGAGGLDLASINIMRGRERGLPDYNTVRENFGLSRVSTFADINSNQDIANTLESLYGDVNNIDAWVGMLAEERMDNALFGELVMKIMEEQFRVIRDGDRYYYENDPTLTPIEKYDIKHTRLYHVLMRNTDLSIMQPKVFEAMPHEEICTASEPIADLNGTIQREDGTVLSDVEVEVVDANATTFVGSSIAGAYTVESLETCEDYQVSANKDGVAVAGVSTLDLVLISKHILNVQYLDSPYKILAADVNNSNSVTTLDLVGIRKLVLRVAGDLPNGKVWGFVPANLTFSDPRNPFIDYNPSATINKFSGNEPFDFVAYKFGDVNNDAPVNATGVTNRDYATTQLSLNNTDFESGDVLKIPVYGNLDNLEGLQFTLHFNTNLEMLDVVAGSISGITSSNYHIVPGNGTMTFSWNGEVANTSEPLFTLVAKAKKAGNLVNSLDISSAVTEALAFDASLNTFNLDLNINNDNQISESFELWQNQPNPFSSETLIGFKVPQSTTATLMVFDLNGKLVYTDRLEANAGRNFFNLSGASIPGNGVFTYTITTAFGSGVNKLVKY